MPELQSQEANNSPYDADVTNGNAEDNIVNQVVQMLRLVPFHQLYIHRVVDTNIPTKTGQYHLSESSTEHQGPTHQAHARQA